MLTHPTTPSRLVQRGVLFLIVMMITSCSTAFRPTDPEYQGSVKTDVYDIVVDVDYCDSTWVMILSNQVATVNGPGSFTTLYDVVGNVVDATVVRDADTLYVASPKDGIMKSINQGTTFVQIPGLDSVGKLQAFYKQGGEFVGTTSKGTIVRTKQQRSWDEIPTMTTATELLGINGQFVIRTIDGKLLLLDSAWTFTDSLTLPRWSDGLPKVSCDETQAIYLAGNKLYRIRVSDRRLDIDSSVIPLERDWRALSVLGNDLVLLAGRNEVWWGSFEEPLQLQSLTEGEADVRIVGIMLSDIGLIAGFRGTEQSLRLNIRNANTWDVLYRPTGESIGDVIWLTRSQGTVFAGTREGGMHMLSSTQRRLYDVATHQSKINVLSVHGTYPNKLMALYDGRVMCLDECTSQPRLIAPPVPFNTGLRVMESSQHGWLLHDARAGLFWSEPNSGKWTPLPLPDTLGYLEYAFRVRNETYLFGQRRLWYSPDNGKRWSRALDATDTVYVVRSFGDELLVISSSGWSLVTKGRVVDTISAPESISTARTFLCDIQNDIVAVQTEKTLYVSNDRGKHWGSLDMALETVFTSMKLSNDRVFTKSVGFGLMMFDIYSDRPIRQ